MPLEIGRLARLTRLGGMAVGLVADAASAAAHRVHETGEEAASRMHRAAAERMLDVLGDMKGLPLKAGQLLSYIDELIPEQHRGVYASVLGRLQADTPALDWELVGAVLQEDLGAPAEELFARLDPRPAAAASIGQVHRATTHDGREVAVKIQYPGVREALQADLENIGALVSVFDHLMPRVQLEAIVHDLVHALQQECDYEVEAANQAAFAAAWAHDPAVVVPAVLPALCGGRVLTSEWVAGQRWATMREQASSEQRNAYGQLLFRFVFESLFRHGMFNGDPHPGNYLFLDGRIAFLDYGCVARFDGVERQHFVALRQAVLDGAQGEAFARAFDGVFPMPVDLDPEVRGDALALARLVFLPVTEPQPYRFGTDYSRRVLEQTAAMKLRANKKLLRGKNAFVLDAGRAKGELLFLGRIAFGLASILGQLDCEGDFRGILSAIEVDATKDEA